MTGKLIVISQDDWDNVKRVIEGAKAQHDADLTKASQMATKLKELEPNAEAATALHGELQELLSSIGSTTTDVVETIDNTAVSSNTDVGGASGSVSADEKHAEIVTKLDDIKAAVVASGPQDTGNGPVVPGPQPIPQG